MVHRKSSQTTAPCVVWDSVFFIVTALFPHIGHVSSTSGFQIFICDSYRLLLRTMTICRIAETMVSRFFTQQNLKNIRETF